MFLGIDWGKFVQPSFWMESRPGALSTRFEIIFLVTVIVLYGLYIMAKVLRGKLLDAGDKIYAKFWQAFASFALTMAVWFTFIFFFRYEAIPYLGGRYWFFIWGVTFVGWFGWLLYRYYKVLPQQVAQREERLAKKKFI